MNLIPGIALVLDQAGNYQAQTVGQVPPTVNASGATTSNYAASLQAGLNPQGLVTPLTIDVSGGVLARPVTGPTMGYAPNYYVATGTTAGKSMMSFFNASAATVVQRISAVYATCPLQSGTSSGLFSSSTYTPVFFAAYRHTGHSAGTAVPGALLDDRDTFDTTNFTVRTGATITGQASAAMAVFDAAYNATIGYGGREDPSARAWTMQPGTGITVTCISALGNNNSVNFVVRAVAVQGVG